MFLLLEMSFDPRPQEQNLDFLQLTISLVFIYFPAGETQINKYKQNNF